MPLVLQTLDQYVFFGLVDPDPLVRGTDPDPSIIKQKYKYKYADSPRSGRRISCSNVRVGAVKIFVFHSLVWLYSPHSDIHQPIGIKGEP
jgi:hypothetical protein